MTKRLENACAAAAEQLIATIRSGDVGTWTVPWHTAGAFVPPTNAATSKPYTGGNWLLALLVGFDRGYSTGLWATYKQWQTLGRQVGRGERGTPLVRWVEPKVKVDAADDGEDHSSGRRVPIGFTVFAPEQLVPDDEALWQIPSIATGEALGLLPNERDEDIDRWIMSTGAVIRHVGSRAFYAAGDLDRICVPPTDVWDHWGDYYATVTHELMHWTGHKNRLARPGVTGVDTSTEALAYEELIAEFGAAMIGQVFGFTPSPRSDHAAYLTHWANQIEAAPATLWSAATAAQKAVASLLTASPDSGHR